ncbi:MAG: hypothetical protein KOO66_00035 [Bacteroidales bacterium]|nr:hypothetical protein [Bacteroidales bacterium]
MKKILILFLCFTLFSNIFVYSQECIYGFLAIPTGNFGNNSGEGAGYAKMGFGLSAEYTKALGASGIGWATSLTIILNSHDESGLEKFLVEDLGIPDDGNISTKSTMNFPILTGIKYQTDILNYLEIFGVFQVGLNFIKPGNRGVEVGGETWEIEYDFYTSFGFSAGGGLILNERFSVGFRYFGLGEPELESSITDPDDNFWTEKIDQKLGVIAITLGVNF